MLCMNVIEPAKSEWVTRIVSGQKKDISLRFCVKYQKLNAFSVKDNYPVPRMDECMDLLCEALICSTLDSNSGYWQIEMAESQCDKTKFTPHRGLYRIICMLCCSFYRTHHARLSVQWT